MPNRFNPRYPQRSRTTPNRTWAGLADAVPQTLAGATKVLFAIGAASTGIDLTILRTRGLFSHRVTTLSGDGHYAGAFGFMVVTDLAAAAGIASIPGPATDVGDDGWFVHEWFSNTNEFMDATGFQSGADRSTPFDSKAKRILEEGKVVVIVVENVGVATMTFDMQFRCLDMVRGTR